MLARREEARVICQSRRIAAGLGGQGRPSRGRMAERRERQATNLPQARPEITEGAGLRRRGSFGEAGLRPALHLHYKCPSCWITITRPNTVSAQDIPLRAAVRSVTAPRRGTWLRNTATGRQTYLGDTAWELFHRLTREDASYLENVSGKLPSFRPSSSPSSTAAVRMPTAAAVRRRDPATPNEVFRACRLDRPQGCEKGGDRHAAHVGRQVLLESGARDRSSFRWTSLRSRRPGDATSAHGRGREPDLDSRRRSPRRRVRAGVERDGRRPDRRRRRRAPQDISPGWRTFIGGMVSRRAMARFRHGPVGPRGA